MNIKFCYLYRDYSNYKKWGDTIFSNPNNLSVEKVASIAGGCLIDQLYFYASKAKLPDLHFEEYNDQQDHEWHEFSEFQATEEIANDPHHRNIEEFLKAL
jgi:hypothetical protein